MKTIKVKDKEFSVSITSHEIDKAVERVANKINEDFEGESPIFLIVLNGSFMFASDLLKKVNLTCLTSFVKLSSYQGTQTTQNVKTLLGLNEEIKGKKIIIIEDIIDTGITMDNFLHALKEFEPADVKIATFLFKPNAFKKDYKIDYIGIEIPNDFIIGYGLDYDGYARNLPDIYKIVE